MSSRGKAKRPTQRTAPQAPAQRPKTAGTAEEVLRAQTRLVKAGEALRAAEKGRRETIRKARASGMSVVELAGLLGVSRQQVYTITGEVSGAKTGPST